MMVLVHVRRVLAKRPWLYWVGVGGLALLAGAIVSQAASGIDDAKAAWGEPRPVLVAVVDVEPGASLGGAATERREIPAPLVPPGAATEVEPGAVARQNVGAGEVVMAHDVGATGGPQALIPDGWLAVAVAEPVPSGARVGDDVTVASGGIAVADDGIVVGVDAESVLVAVPAGVAPQVAHAASTGDVALLVKAG
jgi:Flp pilus assembly protein CpaB